MYIFINQSWNTSDDTSPNSQSTISASATFKAMSTAFRDTVDLSDHFENGFDWVCYSLSSVLPAE
jgi:hypothetical protein